MEVTLFNTDIYDGNYVATDTFYSDNVIAFGKEPSEVLRKAKEKGYDDPVIIYVPENDIACLY